MYISVDKTQQEDIEGFQYTNKSGNEEKIKLEEKWISFYAADDCDMNSIYYEDIPNFIKALKAAYEHKMKEKI